MWNLVLLFAAVTAIAQRPPALELDVHYGSAHASQVLDLYLPAANKFPTIVYTYGGGWHSGSGKSSAPIAEKLRALGYGCALVSHRVFPPDAFPAPAEDLALAFAWVKKNIAARGGDAQRVILAGHSSGAHLSLLIASDPRYLAPHHLTPADILAVIGLSTPVDLSRHADGHGYGDVLLSGPGAGPFHSDESVMRDASPLQHVRSGLPPTLLVTGENDFPMLAADARAFAAKARSAGARVETVVVPGKDHMGVARSMTVDGDPVLTAVQAFLRAQ